MPAGLSRPDCPLETGARMTSKAARVGLNHIALEVGDIEEALALCRPRSDPIRRLTT
jgi:hypothetical protein